MKLEMCAICGHTPVVLSDSLDRGNGHGYPGHYNYHIRCSNDECPLSRTVPMFETDDIYRSKEEAYKYLGNKWNVEMRKIRDLILHRDDPMEVESHE